MLPESPREATEELRRLAAKGGVRQVTLMIANINPKLDDPASGPVLAAAVHQQADLVLLEANPLLDVANTTRRAGVMLRGRWLPKAEIEARLAVIARSVGN